MAGKKRAKYSVADCKLVGSYLLAVWLAKCKHPNSHAHTNPSTPQPHRKKQRQPHKGQRAGTVTQGGTPRGASRQGHQTKMPAPPPRTNNRGQTPNEQPPHTPHNTPSQPRTPHTHPKTHHHPTTPPKTAPSGPQHQRHPPRAHPAPATEPAGNTQHEREQHQQHELHKNTHTT